MTAQWSPVTEYHTEYVNTDVKCSACDQRITVVRDVRNGDVYTECGGEGEGWCSVAMDGNSEWHGRSHAKAIRSVVTEG